MDEESNTHISRGKFSGFPTQYILTHSQIDFVRIYTHKSGDVREGGQKRYNNKNNNNSNNNVDSATTLGLENLCSRSLHRRGH